MKVLWLFILERKICDSGMARMTTRLRRDVFLLVVCSPSTGNYWARKEREKRTTKRAFVLSVYIGEVLLSLGSLEWFPPGSISIFTVYIVTIFSIHLRVVSAPCFMAVLTSSGQCWLI